MTRILLVDDDPIVLKIYQDGLRRLGAQVTTAADGLAAIRALRTGTPDVLVLDLMMPRFSGVDMLKFIRSDPALEALPVVILSNCYMNDLSDQAAALGVQKALLKVRCSPQILLDTIQAVLAGTLSTEDTSLLIATADRPAPPAAASNPLPPPPAPALPPPPPAAPAATADFQAKAREGFLQNSRATCTTLRSLCRAFVSAPNTTQSGPPLQALYRKVHFIAATAGLAQCHRLARLASAFEALLFELSAQPTAVSPSVLHTIAATVDLLALLFDCARDADSDTQLTAQVLVVDDDPMSNRLMIAALQRAELQATSTQHPDQALEWLQQRHFDLVLLDIDMPGMDGFELCRRLHELPGYKKTPVIYVTVHSDFDSRAKSLLSGGDDLIVKPIFPMELAVKAVALLLQRQIPKA